MQFTSWIMALTSLRAWNLIRFQSIDPLEDAAIELSHILAISLSKAQCLIESVLAQDSVTKQTDSFSDKTIHDLVRSRALKMLVGHVTQTHRIPYMTERFDWYLNCLDQLGANGGARAWIMAVAAEKIRSCFHDMASACSTAIFSLSLSPAGWVRASLSEILRFQSWTSAMKILGATA